ncbi:MAG: hypothetical protein ACUVWA_14400 [Candidatus Oleimicrobiaceae bacterium]
MLFLIPISFVHAQLDSQNCTVIGRWAEGDCYDVLANGNIVYFGNGAYLQLMDFTNPINPILLGRIALAFMVRRLALRDCTRWIRCAVRSVAGR